MTTRNRCPDDDCPGWFTDGRCNCCNRTQPNPIQFPPYPRSFGSIRGRAFLQTYSDALTRLEIHTPAEKLNDPAVRAQLYGMIFATQLISRAVNHPAQLERHAYPGQPSHRTQPTTADQVIKVAEQCGITLQPWQQRVIRSLYPAGVQPCRCWYTAWCCRLTLGTYDPATQPYPQPTYPARWCPHTRTTTHRATGFMVNPHCPHHGQANS